MIPSNNISWDNPVHIPGTESKTREWWNVLTSEQLEQIRALYANDNGKAIKLPEAVVQSQEPSLELFIFDEVPEQDALKNMTDGTPLEEIIKQLGKDTKDL